MTHFDVNENRSASPSRSLRENLARRPEVPNAEAAAIEAQNGEWRQQTLTDLRMECETNLQQTRSNLQMEYEEPRSPSHSPNSKQPREVSNNASEPMRAIPVDISEGRAGSKQFAVETRKGSKTTVADPYNVDQDSIVDSSGPVVVRRGGGELSQWRSRTMSIDASWLQDTDKYLWEKYLKLFTAEQLIWLSDEMSKFAGPAGELVHHEIAVEISADWNRANQTLQNPKPTPDVVDELWTEIFRGRATPEYVNYEELIAFVYASERRVIKADQFAGFGMDELESLTAAFKEFCDKVPGKKALLTRDIFDVMQSLGNDLSGNDFMQNRIHEFIKEADVDQSGDIDSAEFLQLMRRIQLHDEDMKREEEHKLIVESGFSEEEIDNWQQLFIFYQDEDGTFSEKHLRSLLEAIDVTLQPDEKKQLHVMIEEVQKAVKSEDGSDCTKPFTFGEFLSLFRKLMDMDFALMETSTRQLTKDRKEEEVYLSPEEIEARNAAEAEHPAGAQPSWFRRLIDTKTKRRATLARKGSKEIVRRGSKDGINPIIRRISKEGIRRRSKEKEEMAAKGSKDSADLHLQQLGSLRGR